MVSISHVNPPSVSSPTGYTQLVVAEGPKKVLYVSGQVSTNASGEKLGAGDLEAQTRQVYSNILAILRSQGASFQDVVKMNTYTTQPEKVSIVRRVRGEFITGERPPASTFVGVTALADPDYLIEIEAIAVLG